ncbi:MAG: DUF4160 domain-containing protein [Chloroflexota bacterium]|nr:DUF4160 domain-containing protein [Chloroflexota bacterium]
MVRVAQRGRFSIYVYVEQGGRHHLPHCHVRWPEGAARLALPNLNVFPGDELPATARRLVEEHKAEINAAWNRLNPGRTV